jgi:excisionase family DNA binding protein
MDKHGERDRQNEKLLSTVEVAGLLGIKETTIYKWCKQGKLPGLKVGKHWRIRREALEDFLKRSDR